MRDRAIGALFLLAIACYSMGSSLAESAGEGVESFIQAAGALLMLGNSVCVAAIGVLMHPVLRPHDENVALGYVVSRCAEAILLVVGTICLLSQQALADSRGSTASPQLFYEDFVEAIRGVLLKANFFAYQMAMCVLGLGSLPVCAALLRSGLLPAWLSIWGLVGYATFLAGGIAELFGAPIGVLLSAPAGLFEIALPFWLFFKGFARDAPVFLPTTDVHAQSASPNRQRRALT